jgi:hypothetical protein
MSGTINAEFFSPLSAVSSSKTYSISLVPTSTSGSGLACYVDEYDVNYKWISGIVIDNFDTCMNYQYTPSSSSVSYARFQVIVEGNSNSSASLSSFLWKVL